MKSKKIFISVITLFICAVMTFTIGLVACNNKEQTDTKQIFEISQTSATLVYGQTLQLTVKTKNVSDELVWSTSDSEVATVDSGKVVATGKGSAVITVKAGSLSGQCEVAVLDTTAPIIVLDYKDVSLIENQSFIVKAKTIWHDKEVENVNYTFETESENISITQYNNYVTIVADSEGKANIVVGAVVKDVTTTAVINVNVTKKSVVFDISNIGVKEGSYQTSLYTKTIEQFSSTITPIVTVVDDGTIIKKPTINWTVSEEGETGIVKVEDGKFIALGKVGSTIVTGKYTDASQQSYTVNVQVDVQKPKVTRTLSDSTINLNMSTEGIGQGYTKIALNETNVENDVRKIYLDGEEIVDVSASYVQDNVVYIANSCLGEKYGDNHTLKMEIDIYEFNLSAFIVTKIATNKASFLEMPLIARKLNQTGYYMLGADIDLEDMNLYSETQDAETGYGIEKDYRFGVVSHYVGNYGIACNYVDFNGTLDGNGYTLKNVKVAQGPNLGNFGFIQFFGIDGALKNIKIDGFTTNANCAFVYGIRGNSISPLIENVYISVKSIDKNWGHCAIFGVDNNMSSARFNNVVVDFTDTYSTMIKTEPENNEKMKAFGRFTESTTFNNVAVVGVPENYKDYVAIVDGVRSDLSQQKVFVKYYDGDTNYVDTSSWKWDSKVLKFFDYSFDFVTSQVTIFTNSSYAIENPSKYWTYTLDFDAIKQGITIENHVITVPENAAKMAYTLTATSIITHEEKVLTFNVKEYTVVEIQGKQVANLNLSAKNGKLIYDEESTFVVDLPSDDLGSVVSIMAGDSGVSVKDAKIQGTKLYIPIKNFGKIYGEKVVTVSTSECAIKFTTLFVSKLATDKVSFLEMPLVARLLDQNGYYMLGANIDLEDMNLYSENKDASTGYGIDGDYRFGVVNHYWDTQRGHVNCNYTAFNGTIDGNGYTVKNMKVGFVTIGNYGFVEYMGDTFVLKNIKIDGFTTNANCAFIYGSKATKGSPLIENVSIKVKSINQNWGHCSIFGIDSTMTLVTFNNVVVDFENTNSTMSTMTPSSNNNMKALGRFGLTTTFSNVAVYGLANNFKQYVGIMVDASDTKTRTNMKDEGVFVEYYDKTTNGATLSTTGWDSTYWNIVDGKPVFKTK